jgi:predicted Fe-Mo cluster-binding NifX family protein
MKIVISATGKNIDSNIDATFGRALFFLIVDTKTKKVKVIENKVRDRPNGVGITIVNTVESEGIDAVITNNIGPLAFETFEQSGVKIYKAEGKINDAIRLFEEGKLSEIKKATKPKYAGLKQKKVI